MSDIDWDSVAESLPSSAGPLLRVVREAYESGGDDAAREVELAVREQIAALTQKFEDVKRGGE